MNIRTLTAIGVITVAGAAAGCSDQTEYGDDDTATTMEPQEQTTPADPSNMDQDAMTAQQRTPADQQLGDTSTEPYATEPEQQMGTQTGDTAGEPMGPDATEFASFDTNSDGELGEDEWQANAEGNVTNLRNMSFAQIDRDSSGSIDLEEFRRAKTQTDDTTGQAADTQSLDPTSP